MDFRFFLIFLYPNFRYTRIIIKGNRTKYMEAIVQVMESTIGARDPYTVGHQQRATQIACAIGAEMGLSSEQLRDLRVAGSLHDLGKVAVPLEILTKPGRLTDLEFSLIKTHPQVGYEILKPLKLSEQINQIILQHHERLDGSGYPQGLKSKEILLEARILGVADVVEAMCSHRPYRPALGLDLAFEEISRQRGKSYDPEVVDICMKLYNDDTATSTATLPELARQPQVVFNHIPSNIISRNREARWTSEKVADFRSWLRTCPLHSRFFFHSAAASLVAYFLLVGIAPH
jgi:HD-GYP domain-containing protein (c-di-GMP phosphodiesterase class II)